MTPKRGPGRPRAALATAQRHERRATRQVLGTLQQSLVRPATAARYAKEVHAFLAWATAVRPALPTTLYAFDLLLMEYVELLWQEGEGQAKAQDTLSGLQNRVLHLRGSLRGAWQLVRAWGRLELPARAPPLPEHFALAIAGALLASGAADCAVAALLGWHCFLRTGELLTLKAGDLVFDGPLETVVLDLGLTKGGSRRGARESVTCLLPWLTRVLRARTLELQPGDLLIPGQGPRFRRLWAEAVASLPFGAWGFKPYSLRRGGATALWRQTGQLSLVTLRGRWAHAATTRVYVNDGLARLAELSLVPAEAARVERLAAWASARLGAPPAGALHMPPQGARPG